MTIVERIDNIYDNLMSLKLSDIVSMLMPISIECKDYEGYCVLLILSIDLSISRKSPFLNDNFKRILSKEGLNDNQIQDILYNALEKYFQICSIDEKNEKILGTSLKKDEEQIETIEKIFETSKDNINTSVINTYNNIKSKYSCAHSYVHMKLTEYRIQKPFEKGATDMKNKTLVSKNVFIIHGHNEAKRRELESLLKDKFNLNPIILLEQSNKGETIIEKFEKNALDCTYAFALFTHEDIVNANMEQYKQVRPNVIFELGWFCGKLGRDRICILEQKCEDGQIASDLQGVMRIQFNDNVAEKYLEIENELKEADII